MKKAVTLAFILLFFGKKLQGQTDSNLWSDAIEANIQTIGPRFIFPNNYRTISLDTNELKSRLLQAPHETFSSPSESAWS